MKLLLRISLALLVVLLGIGAEKSSHAAGFPDGRYLYVTVPGIRNYLEHGRRGLLVFDVDTDCRYLKRSKTTGLGVTGKPINVNGVCASAVKGRVYTGTIKQLQCLDLVSEELL